MSSASAAFKDKGMQAANISVEKSSDIIDQACSLAAYTKDVAQSDSESPRSDLSQLAALAQQACSASTSPWDSTEDPTQSSTKAAAPSSAQESGSGQSLSRIVFFAPAFDMQSSVSQFGSLVGQSSQQAEQGISLSDDSTSQSASQVAQDQEQAKNAQKLLVLAVPILRTHGVDFVEVGRAVPSVPTDAFVATTNVQAIGQLQASNLVKKLKLDSASASDPKRILIAVPQCGNTAVRQAYFSGLWQVLRPYFSNGKAVDPADSRLTRIAQTQSVAQAVSSGEWKQLQVPVTSAQAASVALTTMLTAAQSTENAELASGKLSKDELASVDDLPPVIDGIIAGSDFLAQQVILTLTDAGYTGSASETSPDVSLQGIVGAVTGNADLNRAPVPAPQSKSSSAAADSAFIARRKAQIWPVITGFSSDISTLQSVVSGKQWLTGLDDRATLISQLASLCQAQAQKKSLMSLTTSRVRLDGTDVPLFSQKLIPVDNGTVKTALVDTGYVSAADAGL